MLRGCPGISHDYTILQTVKGVSQISAGDNHRQKHAAKKPVCQTINQTTSCTGSNICCLSRQLTDEERLATDTEADDRKDINPNKYVAPITHRIKETTG